MSLIKCLYFRLSDHVKDKSKLPILIFPEGELISFSVIIINMKGRLEETYYVFFLHPLTLKKWAPVRFFMFLKEVTYIHQGCIYLLKNTVKSAMLWNIITIYNNFYFIIIWKYFYISSQYSSIQILYYYQFWEQLCCLTLFWMSWLFIYLFDLLTPNL